MRVGRYLLTLAVAATLAVPAFAQAVEFKDPTGDDNGPGGYSYPTDGVYKAGSFDLTGLKVQAKGDKVTFDVGVNSNLEDPWGMKTGFALQMVFVFIKTGDGGSAEGLPGLNVKFAPGSEWNKVVILSPQGASRVKAEVGQKAASMAGNIVIPGRVGGAGRSISATVDLAELGGGDPSKWGYQVVMPAPGSCSNGGTVSPCWSAAGRSTTPARWGTRDYISPSHIVPLAGPGIVRKALRWMRYPESPFYVHPRPDPGLIAWGIRFARAARPEPARRAGPLLRDLSLRSKALFEDLAARTKSEFEMVREGLLIVFRTQAALDHEAEMAAYARELGMAGEVLDARVVAALEPDATFDVVGGVFYPQDAHVTPQRLIPALTRLVKERGATLVWNAELRGWRTEGDASW